MKERRLNKMGTHSTIKFKEDNKFICGVYQQYDGYIQGVGTDLAKFLNSYEVINGFGLGDNKNKANGFTCLIAQFIAKFKTGIGNLYMTTEDDQQEFNYIVSCKDYDEIEIEVYYYDREKPMFKGDLKEFVEYCESLNKDNMD